MYCKCVLFCKERQTLRPQRADRTLGMPLIFHLHWCIKLFSINIVFAFFLNLYTMQTFSAEQKNRPVHKSFRQVGFQKLQVIKSRYLVKNHSN